MTSENDLPRGLVYKPHFLDRGEEAELLAKLDGLRFDPIVIRGQQARRTARHFGLDYDYETRRPHEGEPLPGWLLPLRERAAELAGAAAGELVEALVQWYPEGSTIGWHRDARAFDVVVGVSLRGRCRLRLRRPAEPRSVRELLLEPRSAYVLAGDARTAWQHSIPPTREQRYSITFRTLAAVGRDASSGREENSGSVETRSSSPSRYER